MSIEKIFQKITLYDLAGKININNHRKRTPHVQLGSSMEYG